MKHVDEMADFATLERVDWTRPIFSRSQVDHAGEILITTPADSNAASEAIRVVSNWRFSHGYPLQSISMALLDLAKWKSQQSLTAQRIKRIPSIYLKLRNTPAMKLSRMHDIGGCRAIMPSVGLTEKLVEEYEKSARHNPHRFGEFVKRYDYIQSPKPDGYRGVHIVCKYRSNSEAGEDYEGLRIEIQLRSQLQHTWATAVETVSTFTGEALRSNIGSVAWKRFFALASTAICKIEKRPTVPGTPTDMAELQRELQGCFEQVTALEKLTQAVDLIGSKPGHFFLLKLNARKRTIQTETFQQNQVLQAQERYLELEKEIKNKPEIQVVLVGADSVSELRKVYPNYFLDVTEFAKTIKMVMALWPQPFPDVIRELTKIDPYWWRLNSSIPPSSD